MFQATTSVTSVGENAVEKYENFSVFGKLIDNCIAMRSNNV